MRWLIALVAAALLAVSGCSGQTTPSVDRAELIGAGKTADYDFTGTTLEGRIFDGTSLEGKPAVVWFWAPWCPTCRAQSGTVSELAKTYDGKVAVVGVGGLGSKEAIVEVAAQIPHVTHLVDVEGTIWKHFRITAQSTYQVIDANGEIITEGYLDDDKLVDLVDKLAM